MGQKKIKKTEDYKAGLSYAETHPAAHKRALEILSTGYAPLLAPGEEPPKLSGLSHWQTPEIESEDEVSRGEAIRSLGQKVFGHALAKELIEVGRDEARNQQDIKLNKHSDYAKEISFPFSLDDISSDEIKSIYLNELSKAIESTAKSISTDQEVRKDFAEKAARFVEGYLFDLNEANPPPIPDTKFTPRQDEIVPFLRDVWGEWNKRDLLNRQVLGDHDPKALTALVNWLNQTVEPKNKLPDDLHVYTKKEMTERWLEKYYFTQDEVRRAASALNNRQHRSP